LDLVFTLPMVTTPVNSEVSPHPGVVGGQLAAVRQTRSLEVVGSEIESKYGLLVLPLFEHDIIFNRATDL